MFCSAKKSINYTSQFALNNIKSYSYLIKKLKVFSLKEIGLLKNKWETF